jgi:hypothetical protein
MKFKRRSQPFYGMFGRAEKKIPPTSSFQGKQIVHVITQSNRTGFYVEKHSCDSRCIFCDRDFFWLFHSEHCAKVISTYTTCQTCDDRLECLYDTDETRSPISI